MTPLTPGELEVMQVLWDHGRLKPSEIEAHFPRPIRNAALRSALRVLMEKGQVTRRKKGAAFYYEATEPRDRALRKMIDRLADAFSGGSSVELIAQMIQVEKLSEEDVRALTREAARPAARRAAKKGGRK